MSDYAAYWTAIFGDRDAARVVAEFELSGLTRVQLDEWVGTNEAEAERMGLELDRDLSSRVRREIVEEIRDAETVDLSGIEGAIVLEINGEPVTTTISACSLQAWEILTGEPRGLPLVQDSTPDSSVYTLILNPGPGQRQIRVRRGEWIDPVRSRLRYRAVEAAE